MKQQQLLELYDTYSNNVFRLAMSFLGNRADSEDIVQNVYTKLIEKERENRIQKLPSFSK